VDFVGGIGDGEVRWHPRLESALKLCEEASMAVSKQDRDDYERGRADRDLGLFDQAINDIFVQRPDNSAYYKGRDGEQLDGNKKEK